MPKKKAVRKQSPETAASEPVTGSKAKGTVGGAMAGKFPVVGMGASAGGLDALKSFFSKVPEKSGLAYVVVVHMSSKQPSMLVEILQKTARIPVVRAADGQAVEPDQVYVISPDTELTMDKGKIQLPGMSGKGSPLTVDVFLQSLARDQGSRAAAVILSGNGTDGTLGAKEIKANNGLVLAQSEESAGSFGMPGNVIGAGLADMVLAPEEMPEALIRYFSRPAKVSDKNASPDMRNKQLALDEIFALLKTRVGHNFSVYKRNTILRRISRRMDVNHIDSHEEYVRYLRQTPDEVQALFRDLLIGVTRFFRDPESFEVLKTEWLPGLFETMREGATFRAWIPGCSTGEEVYSLAIILRESLETIDKNINLQLFGTDIDHDAIDKAREGLFPDSIAADVGPGRLQRFFAREGNFFRIGQDIRDCVIYSEQDVTKDPPFSHLDLVCCRNLLIYLNSEAQKKLLPLFHYTLNPGGLLMLGSSESVGGFSNLFGALNKKWKIYRRREVPPSLRQRVDFPCGPSFSDSPKGTPAMVSAPQKATVAHLTREMVLDHFAPTAVLIDAGGEILYVQGRTGKYLETPGGSPTLNIVDIAREGLRVELSSILRAAKASGTRMTRRRIAVRTNGNTQLIDLHVCPLHTPRELAGRFLVVFEDVDIDPAPSVPGPRLREGTPPEVSIIAELERELQFTRESHQITIEELEVSNQELKSTNEELQSANEELQSTNEEMESTKEELQSLNEELQTVNAELQSKLEALSAAHDDMRNLLNSTEIATIFVDNNMHIRRFTPEATTIVNLIQTDIGRPLQHVMTNLSYGGMMTDLTQVIQKLVPREAEVQTITGQWYSMRIMPYRTTDNRIDGAVLTFTSIDEQKKVQEKLKTSICEGEHAWELVRAIFDMNSDPMVALDDHNKMVVANMAFTRLMHISQKNIIGLDLFSIQNSLPEDIGLESSLKSALEKNKNFKTAGFEIPLAGGIQRYSIHSRIFRQDQSRLYRILLHFVKEA